VYQRTTERYCIYSTKVQVAIKLFTKTYKDFGHHFNCDA